MASQDLYTAQSAINSLRAAARTATANGTAADLKGYEAALVVIDLGTFAGTTPTATLQVQESDDNSTYTVVAAADLQGGALAGIDTTNDEQLHVRGYLGTKRYLRVAITAIAGTTPSLPCSASIVRGHARHAAVTQGT